MLKGCYSFGRTYGHNLAVHRPRAPELGQATKVSSLLVFDFAGRPGSSFPGRLRLTAAAFPCFFQTSRSLD